MRQEIGVGVPADQSDDRQVLSAAPPPGAGGADFGAGLTAALADDGLSDEPEDDGEDDGEFEPL